jgi:hypothetical protein
MLPVSDAGTSTPYSVYQCTYTHPPQRPSSACPSQRASQTGPNKEKAQSGAGSPSRSPIDQIDPFGRYPWSPSQESKKRTANGQGTIHHFLGRHRSGSVLDEWTGACASGGTDAGPPRSIGWTWRMWNGGEDFFSSVRMAGCWRQHPELEPLFRWFSGKSSKAERWFGRRDALGAALC